tara:strand:- start:16814 stop:17077 length:264 start_codon:yes stop_codon:yes gene_type:complete
MPSHAGRCSACGIECFTQGGEDPICPDCYIPDNPTFGWKVRRWRETKNGNPSELRQFATTAQKEKFLNRELGLKIKKTKPKEEKNDR